MMLNCLASFSLLLSFMLRACGKEGGGVCVCVCVCFCVSVCVFLTTILKMVAGTRQKNPGSQNSIVKMIVTTTLVTKAYLGSLVSVGVVNVC